WNNVLGRGRDDLYETVILRSGHPASGQLQGRDLEGVFELRPDPAARADPRHARMVLSAAGSPADDRTRPHHLDRVRLLPIDDRILATQTCGRPIRRPASAAGVHPLQTGRVQLDLLFLPDHGPRPVPAPDLLGHDRTDMGSTRGDGCGTIARRPLRPERSVLL